MTIFHYELFTLLVFVLSFVLCSTQLFEPIDLSNDEIDPDGYEIAHIDNGEFLSGDNFLADLRSSINGSQISLHLERTSNVNVDAPVFCFENGKIVQMKLPKMDGLGFFHDLRHGASVSIRRRRNAEGYVLEGHLHINGEEHFIHPATENHLRKKRHVLEDKLTSQDGYHVIRKLHHEGTSDYVLPEITKQQLDGLDPKKRSKRQTRRGKTMFGVEFLQVVDYSIFRKWVEMSTERSAQAKERDAVNRIRHYFVHVVNGIDLRYQSIRESDFGIFVRLTGIYIARRATDAVWTEPIVTRIRNGRDQVSSVELLNRFKDWVGDTRKVAQLPPFDHAQLVTRYDMYGLTSSRQKSLSTGGFAFTGTICSTNGLQTSVVEDNLAFSGITLAAHELGHNLGAKHDGTTDGTGDRCKAEDTFIMAGGIVPRNNNNLFRFSRCSVRYFRTRLLGRNANSQCLLDDAQHFNGSESLLMSMPGQMYPVDVQCQQQYGPESGYCRSFDWTSDAEVCRKLFCVVPGGGCRSLIGSTFRAARGTTCGNRKWCDLGECVFNRMAPQTSSDTCFLGNQKGAVFTNSRDTCEDIETRDRSRFIGLCYDNNYFRRRCCKSCKDAETGNARCLYGDRARCTAASCRDLRFARRSCCKTCASALGLTFPGSGNRQITTRPTRQPVTRRPMRPTTRRATRSRPTARQTTTPARPTVTRADPCCERGIRQRLQSSGSCTALRNLTLPRSCKTKAVQCCSRCNFGLRFTGRSSCRSSARNYFNTYFKRQTDLRDAFIRCCESGD